MSQFSIKIYVGITRLNYCLMMMGHALPEHIFLAAPERYITACLQAELQSPKNQRFVPIRIRPQGIGIFTQGFSSLPMTPFPRVPQGNESYIGIGRESQSSGQLPPKQFFFWREDFFHHQKKRPLRRNQFYCPHNVGIPYPQGTLGIPTLDPQSLSIFSQDGRVGQGQTPTKNGLFELGAHSESNCGPRQRGSPIFEHGQENP